MKKLLIIISCILLATACQQNDEEYITQTTELSALYQFTSNPEKQNPNISNSSTRANQAFGGFIVNIIWTPDLKSFKDILDVPYQTALNYLDLLTHGYSSTYYKPMRVLYYGVEHYGIVRIGLETIDSYVSSEMFIREFLKDFTSLMIQASTVGISFDFEYYVDYPEWPPVTDDTIIANSGL